MCSCFSPLLKAIDAYLQKADGDLAEELAAEGYLDSVNTVDEMARLEDDIAAALVEETERFKKAIAGANSLEEFAETVWPEVKRADTLGETLAALFKAAFAKMLPAFFFPTKRCKGETLFANCCRRVLACHSRPCFPHIWLDNTERNVACIQQTFCVPKNFAIIILHNSNSISTQAGYYMAVLLLAIQRKIACGNRVASNKV